MNAPRLCALLPLALLLLGACSEEGTGLVASEAWVLAPAGGAGRAGLTLHNRTDEARTLEHVIAADFRQATLRAEAAADSPPTVEVEAWQTAQLPPEGMALVLTDPKRPLQVGDTTLLTLHFDDSLAVFVEAEVRAAP